MHLSFVYYIALLTTIVSVNISWSVIWFYLDDVIAMGQIPRLAKINNRICNIGLALLAIVVWYIDGFRPLLLIGAVGMTNSVFWLFLCTYRYGGFKAFIGKFMHYSLIVMFGGRDTTVPNSEPAAN